MADRWVVFNPYDGLGFFDTEEEALAAGAEAIKGFLGDDVWDEDVHGVVVAKVVATPVRTVLGRRADMDEDAWDQMTGGSDCDEWFDFVLTRVDLPNDDPPAHSAGYWPSKVGFSPDGAA